MKIKLYILLIFSALCIGVFSCKSDNPTPKIPDDESNQTTSDFPIIDGSESTEPLRSIIVSKLLGCDYHWIRRPVIGYKGLRSVKIDYPNVSNNWMILSQKVLNSNTHPSFEKLINGEVEIIITARGISRDESKYAEEKGVKLLQKAIALDGLAFIVNAGNPVKNLSHQQIKDIYLKKITNWKEVGGNDAEITPYIRNANSGSQEKFETLVMNEEEVGEMELLDLTYGKLMWSPYMQLGADINGIAFTPYYYYKYIVDWEAVKTIGINGIEPGKDSFENKTFPFLSEVIVAIREDCKKDSQAYKLYEYLTTPEGQAIVAESGYIPVGN